MEPTAAPKWALPRSAGVTVELPTPTHVPTWAMPEQDNPRPRGTIQAPAVDAHGWEQRIEKEGSSLSTSWRGVSTPEDVGAGSRHHWFPDGSPGKSGMHVEKFGHSANQTSPLALLPTRARSRISMSPQKTTQDPMGVAHMATKTTTTLGSDVTGSALINSTTDVLEAAMHKTGRPMRGKDFGGCGSSGGGIGWQPSFRQIEAAQRASQSRTGSSRGSSQRSRSVTPNLVRPAPRPLAFTCAGSLLLCAIFCWVWPQLTTCCLADRSTAIMSGREVAGWVWDGSSTHVLARGRAPQ